ncbi:hypothetical protein Dimus_025718 [Dionaea muscipula]
MQPLYILVLFSPSSKPLPSPSPSPTLPRYLVLCLSFLPLLLRLFCIGESKPNRSLSIEEAHVEEDPDFFNGFHSRASDFRVFVLEKLILLGCGCGLVISWFVWHPWIRLLKG